MKRILQKIRGMDETEVQITFMEGHQMRVYAIQDVATEPYIDCIVPTDEELVNEISQLDTVDSVECFFEI